MRFPAIVFSLLGGLLTSVASVSSRDVGEEGADRTAEGGKREYTSTHLTSPFTNRKRDRLRGRRLAYGFDCGCPTTCTQEVLESFGGQYKCGARIEYLVSTGMGRSDACSLVAGVEFPAECGGCDPQSCPKEPAPGPSTCGCESCTADVLGTIACDQNGCFSCGNRLDWLMNNMQLSEYDACVRLARDEFPGPDGPCGPACDPTKCNDSPPEPSTHIPTDVPSGSPSSNPTTIPTSIPSHGPTASPTASPASPVPTASPAVSGPSSCSCASCTQEVLDTYAGEYTCGARINWLQTSEGGSYSEQGACSKVAGEFPSYCGQCDPVTCKPVYLPNPDPAKLVWSDEFDSDGPLDPTRWDYDIGGNGWGNNELQHYTNRIKNSYISDGALHVRAVRETYNGMDFTSARAVTRNLGDWTYGRVQVRARLGQCTGLGTWPAIWMLPTDWAYGGWPSSGEIDIMEHVGYETGRIHGTVHTDAFNHMKGTQVGKSVFTDVTDWHVYEIVWDVNKIEFAMDAIKYHEFIRVLPPEGTYKEWPFDKRFHLILNVAVGGNWGGAGGMNYTAFEGDGQIMEVDWVRVYSL
mmetsp:Transcript_49092/g.90933  ORF Transcript_49092/g.90933 Transcript_49092/m.90933 type:complete len:579 (-) Transcript_49092:225-1961(-)